jgi:hypothetical protein
MAGAKQWRDTSFILVLAAGPYAQQVCAHGAVLQCIMVLVEGGYKQGGRGGEASKSLLYDWG